MPSLVLTSVGHAGDDDAAASSGCDHETGLDDRDDGQTLRLRYHMSCNTHKYTQDTQDTVKSGSKRQHV